MTDITELAQREKFEAWLYEKPFHARYMHWSNALNAYDYTGIQLAWEAYQAGGTELVEALEKAQAERDELQQGFIANQEEAHEAIKYATELKEQLARACAGREEAFREVDEMQRSLDHTHRRRAIWRERAHAAGMEIATLRQRIAELESRTVTVKLSSERFRYGESDYDDGYVNGWNARMAEDTAALDRVGIKWEAE
ncbi:TPA: hypothetical protein RQO42_000712 [Klebsiella michiganensis]|nr:hypothetical protein [Klebsiella michiganensis]